MSFLALFNSDYAPVKAPANGRTGTDKREMVVLGSFRQTALVRTDIHAYASTDAPRAPFDLEGRFWIIGRARLDEREHLCKKLRASPADSDALLCLRSYAQWGEQSPEHLQGDFCFVIWDEDRQRLFCVRDQIGVRPLFYAQDGNKWLVSDALEDIRSHANLGCDLDDHWVADFLTKGYCLDSRRSVYKAIRRIPPAHILIVSSGESAVRRYWTLNIEAPLFYRDERLYIEQFHELTALAIQDRLPPGPDQLGVCMSGGLDSSTLAAKAVMAVGDASRVIAETRCFDHLIPDDERRLSSLVASRLGIRHTLRSVDDTFYDRLWYTRDIDTPEPTISVTCTARERLFDAEMAKAASVWFEGEGPDNALLFEWRAYLRWLWMRRDWRRFGGAAVWCLGSKQARAWPALIRRCALLLRKDETGSSDAPRQWLDDAFVKRLDFAARSREAPNAEASLHRWHPQALASFNSPIWPSFLEGFDAAVWGAPIEWRHPYLDLRVLAFLLSVPPIPWARRKLLIREAMKDALPREVLSRDKVPLIEDPWIKMAQEYPILPEASFCKEMQEFVNESKIPARPRDAFETHALIRVHVLDHWLKNRKHYNPSQDSRP